MCYILCKKNPLLYICWLCRDNKQNPFQLECLLMNSELSTFSALEMWSHAYWTYPWNLPIGKIIANMKQSRYIRCMKPIKWFCSLINMPVWYIVWSKLTSMITPYHHSMFFGCVFMELHKPQILLDSNSHVTENI